MAVSLETLINKSIKAMGSGIHPRVKEYAVELVKRAYSKGIYVQITSGYRSNAEQTKLYNQGRTTKGNIVTNAKAGQSIHNYGLAIDYALLSSSGVMHWDINRDMNSNQVKDWFEVAAIGKSLGFAWGGDWKSFKDYPHLDMQKGLSLKQLAAGKRPTIPVLKTTTPAPKKAYLEYGDRSEDVKMMKTYLNRVGFEVEISDFFDYKTKQAVMAFQRARGLKDDGIYGEGSKAEMNKALKEPKPKEEVKPATPSKPVLKEDEKLELSNRQRQEVAKVFAKARERGVFSSEEHEKAILDGSMTQSTLIYLNNVIAGAGLNGGKRIQ